MGRYEAVSEPACHDCDLLYIDEGWEDFIIPNSIWIKISPTEDAGGLLCAVCICRRLTRKGISGVPGAFLSGPIDTIGRHTMQAYLMAEKALYDD